MLRRAAGEKQAALVEVVLQTPASLSVAVPPGDSDASPFLAAAAAKRSLKQRRNGQGGGDHGTHCAYKNVSPSPECVANPAAHLSYSLLPDQLSLELRRKFVQLHFDEESQVFLKNCKPGWISSFLAYVLRCCLSVTDTNGLLGRGEMFTLSSAQARALLPTVARTGRRASLLDVGAGDGGVTAKLEPMFSSVTATEVSAPMCKRLARRGYTTVQTDSIGPSFFPRSACFDVVSLMNLLDRCDKPVDMLVNARRLLKPDGRLVIALVLPFSEFVESGTRQIPPSQPLDMDGARCGDGVSFETSLCAFCARSLAPAGFVVESVSKTPYLCGGDARYPFYILYDAIIVCSVEPAAAAADAASFRAAESVDDGQNASERDALV